MTQNPIQTAIAGWQAKRIDGTTLMRTLVSFDTWVLPVNEATVINLFDDPTNLGARIVRGADGLLRLTLYSDPHFVPGRHQSTITIKGEWVFDLTLPGVDEIAIDAGQPHEIRYRREQFPRLAQLAREAGERSKQRP